MNPNLFWEIVQTSTAIKNVEQISGISEIILRDYYIKEYYKMLEFGIISFLLCSVLGLLSFVLSLNSIKDTEKLSAYECGFEPFDSATRLPFDVHFYIVGILFLIFDVEIAVLFPWVLGLKFIGWYGFYTMMLFLVILTIGFVYEWQRGALNWPINSSTEAQYRLGGSFFIFTNVGTFGEEKITDVFFWTINKYSTYTTSLEIFNILGEFFLASFICFALVFVATTAKLLDNNSKRVFAVYINNLSIIALIITSLILIETYSNFTISTPLFSMSIIVDSYSTVIKLIINASVIFILTSSHFYLISRKNSIPEFSLIILLATLFLLVLVSSFNLFTAFMSIIGFSLTLYVLIASDVEEHAKREASIKYYYLSVFSSGFLIFGIFLVYLITNSLNYVNIKIFLHNFLLALELGTLNSIQSQSILFLLSVALISMLVGILFKLSAFPCHFWAPEVYDGSPNVITAFLLLPVKIAVFSFFLRLFLYVFFEIYFLWQWPLLLMAVCSMIWGCLCAVNELKIKRFIAFTSINQIGFLLIGIVCNSFAGYQASLIFLLIYIVMNIAFLILFLNTYNLTIFKELKYFGDFKYLKFWQPSQMFYFTIIIFSMAGIPPFAGFFGKYLLLVEAFNSTLYGLIIIALLTSLISAYYYIRIIKISFFETAVSTEISYEKYETCLNTEDWQSRHRYFSEGIILRDQLPIIACLISLPCAEVRWFKPFQKFNKYLYYFIIFFLVGFIFIINFTILITLVLTSSTMLSLSTDIVPFTGMILVGTPIIDNGDCSWAPRG